MYRIKTDIRQYKCESKDKVEKLIRNWVIRPNDLIYHSDKQAWSPIGEHPSFIKLFGMLDEQERNEPDTVVTSNPTRAPSRELGDADSEEVTNVKPRPIFDDEDETDERIEVAADIRETDVIDQDEVAASMSDDSSLAPPEAPEGVEPAVKSEEVTMMTEKTLDLLTITDEDEAVKRKDSDAEPGPSPTVIVADDAKAGDEEVTDVRDREDVSSDLDENDQNDAEESESEDTENDESLEEPASSEPSEPEDDETEESEVDDHEEETEVEDAEADEDDDVAEEMAAASVQDSKLSTSKPRGRHNLPEEFFATNEISTPVDRDAPVIDDLSELPEGASESSEVDEAWDDMAEDLRSTDELDPADIEAGAAQVDGEGEEKEAGEFEEDEWDEYENELDAGEVAAELFGPKGDRVADPYAIPLPFEIVPQETDTKVGLKRSSRSRSVKDRSFPYPSAKERGRVYTKNFDLTAPPPVDKTAALIFGVFFVFVLLFAMVYLIF